MTDEELKEWFIDIWNSCYAVKHDDLPDCIFLFYDESVVRKMKLCKLNNIEYKIDKVKGKCLFQQNYTYNNLYCDYDEIWSVFEDNYSVNYKDIQAYIKSILEEQDKLKVLTPRFFQSDLRFSLEEQDKLKVLTPQEHWPLWNLTLEEQDKLKLLTPFLSYNCVVQLEEQDKMMIL